MDLYNGLRGWLYLGLFAILSQKVSSLCRVQNTIIPYTFPLNIISLYYQSTNLYIFFCYLSSTINLFFSLNNCYSFVIL